MTTFAFLDTETDGLGPNRHVWEIAVITVTNHATAHETTTRTHLFLPLDAGRSDGPALAVGGYWQRHPEALARLADDPKPQSPVTQTPAAARAVLRATHEAIVVGVNPAFDTQSLERILRGAGLAPTWDHRLIDMRAFSIGYLLGQGLAVDEASSSDELSTRCGIAPPDAESRHTAMGDAEWAQRWFYRLALGEDL